MPKAPLNNPEAMPTPPEAAVPGMDFSTKPRAIKNVTARTKTARAICIGAAGTLARSQTPSGVPMTQPMMRGAKDRQWMSFQMPGRRCRLAAISSMKTAGMKVAGGISSDSEVMTRSEKPKPE